MRTYPRNSPHAAARIVALTLLADGHLGGSELAALDRLAAAGRLGLDPLAAAEVMRDVVQDLLATGGAAWQGTAHLDASILAGVLCEIDDALLRTEVLHLCRSIACADRHVSEGEQAFLATVAQQWDVPVNGFA